MREMGEKKGECMSGGWEVKRKGGGYVGGGEKKGKKKEKKKKREKGEQEKGTEGEGEGREKWERMVFWELWKK